MSYRTIVHAIASLTNVRCEEEIVKRPKGVKNWAFNEDGDSVYKIYMTNFDIKNQNGSFGFWKYNKDLDKAYKEAFFHLLSSLKWSYKIRLKKWLRLR